ncbi:hypothetical protein GBA52_011986 [Prunus armeniaca]|nr:hypothetical protein GBA52_011986 [Prunus armeniaca]
MRHRQLPEDLRERVRRFMQYKWFATRGVDEESILRSLPLDLCHEIQRHLCLNLVRRDPPLCKKFISSGFSVLSGSLAASKIGGPIVYFHYSIRFTTPDFSIHSIEKLMINTTHMKNSQEEEGYYYYDEEQADGNYENNENGGRSGESTSNTGSHIGVTFLASKFAANTKRGIAQKAQAVEAASTSLGMPRLFKPDEPDFSVE